MAGYPVYSTKERSYALDSKKKEVVFDVGNMLKIVTTVIFIIYFPTNLIIFR
jgi:hypothetical protein